MMSISTIGNAGAASDYYTEDDSGCMEVLSEWFGNGAEALGLNGGVDSGTLKSVLEGQVGDQQLGRKMDGKHKAGWDLTFSAPKSVSIMALAAGDQRLVDAHLAAVKDTLATVEARQVITRQSVEGITQPVKTGNLTAALCTHTTSRDLDPQLHTHAVVANATQGEDGKWRSIESKPMFETIKHTGQIYRNHLATRVAALGYELEANHKTGLFEIKGVPKETIDFFSSRRHNAIEPAIQNAAEQGRELKTAKAVLYKAVFETRDNKQAVLDKEALVQSWQDSLGFRPEPLIAEAQARAETLEVSAEQASQTADKIPASVLNDVRVCYRVLADKEAVFTREALSDMTLKWGLGNITDRQVHQAIDQLVAREELVPSLLTVNQQKEPALTTPEALKRESQLLKQLNRGQDRMTPIHSPNAVQASIERSGKTLNEGQQQAVALIGTSRDQIIGVQGLAGTGKTYMLEAAKTLVEDGGYSLRGLAPTHSAVRTLQNETGMASETLASFLNDVDQGKAEIGQKEVWIVDEASLISTKNMTQLFSAAQQHDSRICLVGDHRQIGSVEWGKPFEQLVRKGMAHAEMNDIRRQKDERLLKAVEAAVAFNPKKTLDLIASKGDVRAIASNEQRQTQLVQDYLALSPKERENTLVIVPDNESRTHVMNQIRQELIKEGSVSDRGWAVEILERSGLGKEETRDARFYQPGQVVEFERPYKNIGPGILKGNRFHVVAVDRQAGEVTLARYHGKLNEQPETSTAFAFHPSMIRNKQNVISVYDRAERTFSANDTIVWNKTRKDQGFRTGSKGQVLSVNGTELRVQFEDGVRTLETLTMKNFDYGYAQTVHTAQGQTVDRVLALTESWRKNLVNQKSFYVALSRARHSARLYTNDQEKLTEAILDRSGEKTSAIESVKEEEARKHRHNIKDELQEAKEQKEKEVQQQQKDTQKNLDKGLQPGRKALDLGKALDLEIGW